MEGLLLVVSELQKCTIIRKLPLTVTKQREGETQRERETGEEGCQQMLEQD